MTATVSDGAQSASRSFTWTVTPDATAPAVAITAPTTSSTYATSATPLTLSGTASDSVGVTQVSWANNRGGSGTATGTTSWSIAGIALQSGANVMTVTARDAAGNVATATLTVTFNSAPVLAAIANQSTAVGTAVSLQLAGSDPDGGTLTYTATGLPAGLVLASGTGMIAGTPTTGGTYSVTATVSDGTLTASRTFTWTILAGDTSAPVIVINGPTLNATYTATTSTLVLSGTASDNVGVTQVTWASNRGGSGTASGTTAWTGWSVPLLSGTNVLTVTARDAAGNTATDVLTVTYNVANVAPTLASVSNRTTRIGQTVSLQLVGADANGDVLTYSATGLPAGLSLNASTGLISGSPTTVGTYVVSVTVSDGSLTRTRTFTWTIRTP